tara:strand:+ start:597 stop:776 length:180 start_codon:yes stop_codon:yes gene_type:complete
MAKLIQPAFPPLASLLFTTVQRVSKKQKEKFILQSFSMLRLTSHTGKTLFATVENWIAY